MRRLAFIVVALFVGAAAPSQCAEPMPLPVRKVVLFKNGIGYF